VRDWVKLGEKGAGKELSIWWCELERRINKGAMPKTQGHKLPSGTKEPAFLPTSEKSWEVFMEEERASKFIKKDPKEFLLERKTETVSIPIQRRYQRNGDYVLFVRDEVQIRDGRKVIAPPNPSKRDKTGLTRLARP